MFQKERRVGTESEKLIYIIKTCLNDGIKSETMKAQNFDELFLIARNHGVETFLYAEGCDTRCAEAYEQATLRHLIQMESYYEITRNFEKAGICYTPLKGVVMKELYPSPLLRTMQDIDIYIGRKYADDAKKVMEKLRYVTEKFDDGRHDVYVRGKVIAELHTDTPFEESALQFVPKKNGAFLCPLSANEFFISLVLHIKKHMLYGGIGIRAFIDVYVYMKSKRNEIDFSYVKNFFVSEGLEKFYNMVTDLCAALFDNGEMNDVLSEFAAFVLESGMHGTLATATLNGNVKMDTGKDEYRNRIFFRALFPKFISMKKKYPILRRLPILLPLFYFRRIISAIPKRKKYRSAARHYLSISEKKADLLKDFYNKIGL